ncbi:MAG: site-specific integrase [Streptococcaceae bacterium]|jgi:integrase|nr:site-specific integrase [Streptococcaceae bacterium]
MWMEKMPSGKYRYNEEFKDKYTNKRKKVSITLLNKTRETQNYARIELQKKIERTKNKKSFSNSNITLEELKDEWFPIYMQQVKSATIVQTKFIIETCFEILDKDSFVRKIDAPKLNKMFYELLYTKKLSNKYVSIMKSKLSTMFKYAKNKGYILSNPINEVEIDYKRENKSVKIKDKFLEDDEYKKIIEYSMGHNKRYGLFFQWLYLTGLRAGEAIVLTKSDFHFSEDRNYVSITGTAVYHGLSVGEQIKSKTPKTNAGIREVDLSKRALDIYHKSLNISKNDDLIFTTANGTYLQISAINSYLRQLKKILDIEKPLSSHIFRHTHISKLAELQVPIYSIQERVGHENSKITEQIYLHITEKMKQDLRNKIEKL